MKIFWVEEKTHTMIAAIVYVTQPLPEFKTKKRNEEFLTDAFEIVGAAYRAFKRKIHEARCNIAKWKKECERELRNTGSDPAFYKLLNTIITLREKDRAPVKAAQKKAKLESRVAKLEVKKLKEALKLKKKEYDLIQKFKQSPGNSWASKFASLSEEDKKIFPYELRVYLEAETKEQLEKPAML